MNFELRPSSHAHGFHPRLNLIWKDNHKTGWETIIKSISNTISNTISKSISKTISRCVGKRPAMHTLAPTYLTFSWPPSHSHILSASLRNKLAFPECTRTNPPQGAVQMPRKITTSLWHIAWLYFSVIWMEIWLGQHPLQIVGSKPDNLPIWFIFH